MQSEILTENEKVNQQLRKEKDGLIENIAIYKEKVQEIKFEKYEKKKEYLTKKIKDYEKEKNIQENEMKIRNEAKIKK